MIKGNHTLKFGANFRRNRVTDFGYQSGTTGSYYFANLQDFANGVTNSSDNGNSYYYQKFSPLDAAHIRLYNIGIYAQDEWAIKPNLKLTYGIRLDRTADPLCIDKCYSLLTAPFTSSAFQKGVDIPYDSSINTGLSHAYYNTPAIVPDPRVGLVWSPKDAHGLVIRGGFGVFSDLSPAYLVSQVFNNAPYPYSAEIYDGSVVGTIGVPGSAAQTAQSQFNTFKSGFFGGETLAQLQASLPSFSPFSYFSIPQKFNTATYEEWSLRFRHPLAPRTYWLPLTAETTVLIC